MNEEEVDEYRASKKMIDADFSRFIRLEKAWISNISHKIMPIAKGYEHIDRKEMRELLLKYLTKKVKGHEE